MNSIVNRKIEVLKIEYPFTIPTMIHSIVLPNDYVVFINAFHLLSQV